MGVGTPESLGMNAPRIGTIAPNWKRNGPRIATREVPAAPGVFIGIRPVGDGSMKGHLYASGLPVPSPGIRTGMLGVPGGVLMGVRVTPGAEMPVAYSPIAWARSCA